MEEVVVDFVVDTAAGEAACTRACASNICGWSAGLIGSSGCAGPAGAGFVCAWDRESAPRKAAATTHPRCLQEVTIIRRK